MTNPESHKTRGVDLGLPVGEAGPNGCSVCGGRLKPGATKFCSLACYRVSQRGADPVARFWSKVRRTDGCWLWTGSRSGGRNGSKYGQFTVTTGPGQQQHFGAHVYSYQLANGPVPDGLEVMHLCHQKLCVRPSHLAVGTHAQNVKDSAKEGHYNVPRPRRQKITDDQVEQAIGMVRAGMTQSAVAKAFGVTKVAISRIMRGTMRQHRQPSAHRRTA